MHRDTILIEHLWEFGNIPPSEGVRTAEWKYFRYVNDKSAEELYHLAADPRETQNLAAQPAYQQILQALRDKCDQLTQRFADPYSGIPSGLMVEYIRDPRFSQITDKQPEFSWTVPTEAGFQQAYQVLVASGSELLANNLGPRDFTTTGETDSVGVLTAANERTTSSSREKSFGAENVRSTPGRWVECFRSFPPLFLSVGGGFFLLSAISAPATRTARILSLNSNLMAMEWKKFSWTVCPIWPKR